MIGRNVHVAVSSYIFGMGGRVVLSDFCGLSARVSLFTATVITPKGIHESHGAGAVQEG